MPEQLQRGSITSTDILKAVDNESECKILIKNWAMEVYKAWNTNHKIVDKIATGFLNGNVGIVANSR